MAEELAAILPQEFGLQMIGVVHAGVPNQERVVLRAAYPLDLSAYFLVLGWRLTEDRAWPLNADSFWFGKTTVSAGHWVLVYTGVGQQTFTTLGPDPCLVLYWNKPNILFPQSEIVPILIHVESVAIGKRL
jgi:hypothetical protein